MSTQSQQPWLLYSYPWMPFPRRVAGYLTEKRIPQSAITIVHVSNPQKGDCVIPSQADKYPPRPQGSLPILAIPPDGEGKEWLYVRQSMAMIYYIEEACASDGALAHVGARELLKGTNPLERARIIEILALAEELLVAWNPVRTFGTGAGTLKYPEGSKEMLRWIYRTIATVDRLFTDRDLSYLKDEEKSVTIADIVLFQFLDFIDYCYGVDLTKGSGADVKDVYGRDAKEEYPRLNEFYENFKRRNSAKRNAEIGELASDDVLKIMQTWHDGIL